VFPKSYLDYEPVTLSLDVFATFKSELDKLLVDAPALTWIPPYFYMKGFEVRALVRAIREFLELGHIDHETDRYIGLGQDIGAAKNLRMSSLEFLRQP
jgi:hypothetical protein